MWAAVALLFGLMAWTVGLVRFAGQVPSGVDDPSSRTDAIVVLTGGSQRLQTGLRLLAEKAAAKLFVSGVHRGVDVTELLRVAQRSPREVDCCIVLGYGADDTAGNAWETAEWMAEERYHSLRLVTANYHMQRSLVEFRRVMPDIAIVPHPVNPDSVMRRDWWQYPGTARLLVREYNKYLVALLRQPFSAISGGRRLAAKD